MQSAPEPLLSPSFLRIQKSGPSNPLRAASLLYSSSPLFLRGAKNRPHQSGESRFIFPHSPRDLTILTHVFAKKVPLLQKPVDNIPHFMWITPLFLRFCPFRENLFSCHTSFLTSFLTSSLLPSGLSRLRCQRGNFRCSCRSHRSSRPFRFSASEWRSPRSEQRPPKPAAPPKWWKDFPAKIPFQALLSR